MKKLPNLQHFRLQVDPLRRPGDVHAGRLRHGGVREPVGGSADSDRQLKRVEHAKIG